MMKKFLISVSLILASLLANAKIPVYIMARLSNAGLKYCIKKQSDESRIKFLIMSVRQSVFANR